jgi:hypothetical protein
VHVLAHAQQNVVICTDFSNSGSMLAPILVYAHVAVAHVVPVVPPNCF